MLKKQHKTGIIVFAIAVFIVILAFAFQQNKKAKRYEMRLQQTYERAVEELGNNVNNITATLNKGRFAGTTAQNSQLSAELWRESTAAKTNLSQLPLGSINLNNTSKFFSQCGDYAMSISRKLSNNQKLTPEEENNIQALYEYSTNLNNQVQLLKKALNDSDMSLYQVLNLLSDENIEGSESIQSVNQGFKDLEDGLAGFPTLIYDGPFSDDLLEKEPLMTKDAPIVDREVARQKAAESISIDPSLLSDDYDEEGAMPSYCFKSDRYNIAVTKNGGFISYLIDGRDIGEAKLTIEEGLESAQQYIDYLKITDLTKTYYELTNENVLIINYAYITNNITCYTDLVKIEVALDNGDIIGFDSRGFLTNHKERTFPTDIIGLETALEKINNNLIVEDVKMALIPSQGSNEVYTYEFKCKSKDDQRVLVYIDAVSGAEQQILILIESEKGILTM